MTFRRHTQRSRPPFIRAALVITALFIFSMQFFSGGHSTDSNAERANAQILAKTSQTINTDRGNKGKVSFVIKDVHPLTSTTSSKSNAQAWAQLGDFVAYSGDNLSSASYPSFTPTRTPTRPPTFERSAPVSKPQPGASTNKGMGPMQDAPTSEPTPPPTPPGMDNYTPLVPNSSPTIYVTNVDGRFFYGGSTIFNMGTQTPPAFTQVFPLINFNPVAGYICQGTPVDADTRPLTDVNEGNPCAAIPAQATAPAPTPTLLQAGVGVLAGYQDVLSTTIYVSQPADVFFYVDSDDGFVWGIGPLNGIPGNPQPSRVSGVYAPPPPVNTLTPYPTTTFRNFTIVGRMNDGNYSGGTLTVRFPVAGFYPIEVDNAENGIGGLNISMQGPIQDTPIPNGPSATATATPTAICSSSSDWCTHISPNFGIGHNELRGVAVISQDHIWAVGGYNITAQGGQSLVEFWNNTQWSVVSSPDVGSLNGIVAVGNSNSDIYAVGDTGILHYDGTTWNQVSGRPGGNGIGAVKSQTVYNIWVVGSAIQRYDNTTWTSFSVPDGGILNGVAVITATNVTAVGYTGIYPNRRPKIVQWDGNAWTTVSIPSFGSDSYLTGIDFYDGTHLWAVGSYYYSGDDRYETLTLYGGGPYNSRTWRSITSPNPGAIDNRLNHVWVDTEGDVWAVGSYWPAGASGSKTLIMRWNDTAWAQIDSPAPGVSSNLLGIATIPGDTAVVTSTWAVGSYLVDTYGASQTLVERIQAIQDPHTNLSYYENNLDAGTLDDYYTQGCYAAKRGDLGVIVLDFGQPQNLGTSGNPRYGTQLIGFLEQPAYITDPNPTPTGTPASPVDITHAVERFAKGYHDAYHSGVPIPNCPYVAGPVHSIVLAVGINNQMNATVAPTILPTPTVEISGHAIAWAAMVKAIRKDIASYSEISVVAAIDAEPNFDTGYVNTRQWAEAYDSRGVSRYYNFGSTDSYPLLAAGTPTPVVPPPFCCSAWTVDQLYHLSYGISQALSLPEIYSPQFAREWNRVKRWSIESNQPLPLYFSGEMSECRTSPCGISADNRRFFNEEEAWKVFWLQINGDPDTRQFLTYSTDIKCSNGYTSGGCSQP